MLARGEAVSGLSRGPNRGNYMARGSRGADSRPPATPNWDQSLITDGQSFICKYPSKFVHDFDNVNVKETSLIF